MLWNSTSTTKNKEEPATDIQSTTPQVAPRDGAAAASEDIDDEQLKERLRAMLARVRELESRVKRSPYENTL